MVVEDLMHTMNAGQPGANDIPKPKVPLKRLTVIAGSTAGLQSLSFQCDDGKKKIVCGITSDALRNLIGFHRLNGTNLEAARALVSEVERLANAKYNDAGFEENGELLIRLRDLLRYGFQDPDKLVA